MTNMHKKPARLLPACRDFPKPTNSSLHLMAEKKMAEFEILEIARTENTRIENTRSM
jgi:hypothetical protein